MPLQDVLGGLGVAGGIPVDADALAKALQEKEKNSLKVDAVAAICQRSNASIGIPPANPYPAKGFSRRSFGGLSGRSLGALLAFVWGSHLGVCF